MFVVTFRTGCLHGESTNLAIISHNNEERYPSGQLGWVCGSNIPGWGGALVGIWIGTTPSTGTMTFEFSIQAQVPLAGFSFSPFDLRPATGTSLLDASNTIPNVCDRSLFPSLTFV